MKNSQTLYYKTYYHSFTYEEMQHYFYQLIKALSESHQLGVMHLDLKPANVIYE
jgi:casein kinase II subunit alpha